MKNKLFSFLFIFNLIFLQSYATVTEFILIRHGETIWNAEGRTQGQVDIPLNEKGIQQAELLAEKIVAIHPDLSSTIYSSDLSRAIDTARKTAEAFKAIDRQNIQIIQTQELRELNYGVAEGTFQADRIKRYKECDEMLKKTYPDRKERWNYTCIEGAETFNALVERTKSALKQIAEEHPDQKVALFVHGRLMATLITETLDDQYESVSPPNCAVAHFKYTHENQEQPLEFISVKDLLK